MYKRIKKKLGILLDTTKKKPNWLSQIRGMKGKVITGTLYVWGYI